ncbi:histidine--tRNA ligase [archaeon]|nr:histidine--tRNA ligase [archaeon]
MELMNARGTKDFAPEEKIVRQQIVDTLRRVFELYGFSPLETPIIERFEVLSAKYAGGAEIMKETFKFSDQGERDIGLRYDLTVPLARFVGMNPTLKMPFKRYQIDKVFRDGPVKSGRMREFWQCDVDIVGSNSLLADAQCIQIAQKAFEELELDVNIEINSRKILDGIVRQEGVAEEKVMPVILEIDKLKKTGVDEVKKAIEKLGVDEDAITKILGMFSVVGSNAEKIKTLRTFVKDNAALEGIKEVEEMLSYVDDKNVVFNPALARGLSYYTGPVFEAVMKDESIFGSSLGGGGRWDKMIGSFIGAGKEYPAVGISFGLEPIFFVMTKLGKVDTKAKTQTKAYIIPIKTSAECMKIAEEMRKSGINTDLDISARGISKNLDYANSLGIPYVIFAGEDELKQKKVKLRDMKTGKEELLAVKDVVKRLK